jgi:RNA polymerase sigma-70 factor (ECF subfamily)
MPAAKAEGPAASHEEARLLAAARRGDRTAFAEIVMRHQSNVRRQLRHALHGDAAAADELAQDAFVLAWRGLATFRGESSIATWLHRIAHRRFLMHARSAASRIETTAASDPGDDARAEAGELAPDAALRVDMERALAALPEAQRLALFHCYQLDLSHEEAATVLGWPLGTLKSHVARGKSSLRERLAAWAPAGGAAP